MVSNLFVLMKSLHTRWESSLHNSFFLALCSVIAILLSLPCPLISRVLVFFCPLLCSTSACCLVVYMFILSDKDAVNQVSFSTGESSAYGVLKVYDEINLSICNDKIRMACFFLKSDICGSNSLFGEDSEQITFAGKLEADRGTGAFDEGVASLKVDNMAEGLWNHFLGRYSMWHYQKDIVYEITD